MIKRCQLIEVSIAGLRISAMQFLRQLQHIIGVTGFRTIDIGHEILASLLAGEVFTTAIATECQRAFTSHDIPEISTSGVISLITREF